MLCYPQSQSQCRAQSSNPNLRSLRPQNPRCGTTTTLRERRWNRATSRNEAARERTRTGNGRAEADGKKEWRREQQLTRPIQIRNPRRRILLHPQHHPRLQHWQIPQSSRHRLPRPLRHQRGGQGQRRRVPLQLRAARARKLHREPHQRARYAAHRGCGIPAGRGGSRRYLGRGEIPLYDWVLELGAWTRREGTVSRDDFVYWTAWAVGVDGVQWGTYGYGVVGDDTRDCGVVL